MHVQRGAVDAFRFEEATDETAVPIVANAGHDPRSYAEPREPGGHVAGETAHESLEGAYLFERSVQLLRIQVRAYAAENVRVDGHAASTSVRYARLRFASRSGAAIGLTPSRTSCSTMSQPA